MKQGLFEVFGTGKLGLKADDMNQYFELVTSVGMSIPEGIVIATSIFDSLVEQFDFKALPEEIEKYESPNFLLSINQKILDILKVGVPYVIRSSALSERGGTGIYKSTFFVPTGNKIDDLKNLWSCELLVYSSEFTQDAKQWRNKNKTPIGMAVLIQPVIGCCFEDYFLPALAGVAYTSYNGLPTVRVVIVLGTQAVNGGGIIYNQPLDRFLYLREMWEQEFADSISTSGEVIKIRARYPEIFDKITNSLEEFSKLFEKMTQLQKYGNFYLEWAISNGKMFIVQITTYEDKLVGNASFNSDNYFLFTKSNDVLHSGRASCKCIVYIHKWSLEISQYVKYLNEATKDYLLIVPQDALSQLAEIQVHGSQLTFQHFSNALAVVEKQTAHTEHQSMMLAKIGQGRADHSNGMGATHFSQLCKRANILFAGAEFDSTPLLTLPGGMNYHQDKNITIWNISAEVVINTSTSEGFVYISKLANDCKYSLYQLQDWSDILRSIANSLEDHRDTVLANHFYAIHYSIAFGENPVGFNPFKLDESAVADFGEINGIINSLKIVISNGEQLISNDIWSGGLKNYLEDLLTYLIK